MNQFCDCNSEGYCTRYQREMGRRMWEICSAINCDLGTSAMFREQWKLESPYSCTEKQFRPTPLLLKTDQCPGDALVMTAAIYSLHKAYPGKYLTSVQSPYPEIFQYNPDVCLSSRGIDNDILKALPIQMHYPAIHDSNKRGIHFMQGYCEHLGHALGIHVPLLTNRPHIYFDHWAEPDEGSFWLVCSGGKNDLTNKLWGYHNYQSVINRTWGRIKFIQIGDNEVNHPLLRYTIQSQVGKTNLRQLFNLIQRCRGVLCGVSLPMHIAAALDKPCVVIAGGREPVTWNVYPKQHYLHTVGMLECTDAQNNLGGACWRSRVLPQGDGGELDKNPCLFPVMQPNSLPLLSTSNVLPKCMTLIKPQEVADLILKIDENL